MRTNALPAFDTSVNPTGCCPLFDPEEWKDRALHFENKLFARTTTKSENFVPIDMAHVFEQTMDAIDRAGARGPDDAIVLSRDLSPSEADHYFAVSKPVPGLETVRWSGDFFTKVFEGPYENTSIWRKLTIDAVHEHGRHVEDVFFFYTTCPACAELYGRNFVVAVAKLTHSN